MLSCCHTIKEWVCLLIVDNSFNGKIDYTDNILFNIS